MVMNRKYGIDWNKVFPLSAMGDSDEESALLSEMAEEARAYLIKHRWCADVPELYWGLGVGKCFAVFLAGIRPAVSGVDEYLWVITGDLPPLYLVADHASCPAQALYEYITVMRQWADAAVRQEHNPELLLPPVDAAFTKEHGEMLSKRLDFMEDYLKLLLYMIMEDYGKRMI